jgi:Abnormal spindle-like microcephaly-assoc'd, ASPM-SPD-2-Hydin
MSLRFFFAPLLLAGLVLSGCNKDITVNSPTTDFGYVWIGQSALKGVAWTNTTHGPVEMQMMQKLTPPFGFKPLSPSTATLPPGGIYGLEIIASPDEAGLQTQELVPSNLQGLSVEPTELKVIGLGRMEKGCLTLSGGYISALPAPPAGPGGIGPTGSPNNGPLDFGTVLVGSHSEKTLTINNSSANAVQANVSVVSRGTNPFSASMSTAGAPLKTLKVPANSSITIIVGFKPTFAGTFEVILQIYEGADFNSSNNVSALALTGIGRAGE